MTTLPPLSSLSTLHSLKLLPAEQRALQKLLLEYGAACAAAAAEAERAKCGGENCMGRRLDGNTNWVTEAARDAAVAAEREHASADTDRLAYLFSNRSTTSTALVDAEIRLFSGESLTLEEARAAVDEAMRGSK